jgi:hypothetical protein
MSRETMSAPRIRPKGIMVVEDIDCQACNNTGREGGDEPTFEQRPFRWCSSCDGAKVRHRLMSLEDFAKLFQLVTIGEHRDDCLNIVYRTEIRAVQRQSTEQTSPANEGATDK